MAKDSQSTRYAAAGAIALGAGAAALAPVALKRLLDGTAVGEIMHAPGAALGQAGSKLGHSLADRRRGAGRRGGWSGRHPQGRAALRRR